MGKDSASQPSVPDPAALAAAQTKTNQDTALFNANLNHVNQNTTFGSISYSQTGGQPTYDNAAFDSALKSWQAGQSGGGQYPGYTVNNGILMKSPGGSSGGGAMPKLSD